MPTLLFSCINDDVHTFTFVLKFLWLFTERLTGLSFSFIARMLEKSWRYDLVLELGVFLEDAVCPINTIKVSGTGPTWSRACENVPHQVAAFWASARLPKGGCPSRGISPTRSSLSLDIDGTFPFNVWTESGHGHVKIGHLESSRVLV